MFPELNKYVGADRDLYGILRKALYGCVQASKLWFLKLTKFLRIVGYESSEVEPCTFRKVEGDGVFLLVVYVDDILIIALSEEISRFHQHFVDEFQWVTLDVGNKQSYLGMQIEFFERMVQIDMRSFIEKILVWCDDHLTCYQGPGKKDLFTIAEESALGEKIRRKWHTIVAKLLYLAKRARPDILTVVSFLCIRVKGPTNDDQRKLLYLLGYLSNTKERLLILAPQKMFYIEAYVDASFVTHMDGKSHMDVFMKIGGVGVYFASRKQKCVSKSPTEAELIALPDNVGFVELFHEFLSFILNCYMKVPTVYQDNTSLISLVTLGGGKVRTKHLRTRMYLTMEALQEKKLCVKYIHTSEISADGLTKVLEGSDFDFFVDQALGTNKSTSGH